MRGLRFILALIALSVTIQTAKAQCNVPSLSVFNIISDSASLSWTTSGAVLNCEYAVLPASSSQPTAGTASTGTSIRVGGLLPGTAYKAWIKANCTGSVASAWGSVSFTTPCGVPSTITISNIQGDSADISWTSVSPGANYQYAVDTLSSPPSNGTNISTNSTRIKGLKPAKIYYVFVRTDCGNSVYSYWSSYQSFFSAFATYIPAIINQKISVYPNPVTDVVTVSLPGVATNASVTIYNALGSTLCTIQASTTTIQADLSKYPSGIYTLKYTDDSGCSYTKLLKR